MFICGKQTNIGDRPKKCLCVFHQTDRPRTDSANSYSLTTHSL